MVTQGNEMKRRQSTRGVRFRLWTDEGSRDSECRIRTTLDPEIGTNWLHTRQTQWPNEEDRASKVQMFWIDTD